MDEQRYLIQILLPLADNDGRRFGEDVFGATRAELTDSFGGLTAHVQAPARGLWKTDANEVTADDVVIFEVMAASLDVDWWRQYRHLLERRFRQEAIVARAMALTML